MVISDLVGFIKSWFRKCSRRVHLEERPHRPYRLERASSIFKPLYLTKHCNKTSVKWAAFEAPRLSSEISVADATGVGEEEKRTIGKAVLDLINSRRVNERPFKICGYAHLPCHALMDMPDSLKQLEVFAERDDTPFDRHTNIKGFPPPSEDLLRQALSTYLATQAELQPP